MELGQEHKSVVKGSIWQFLSSILIKFVSLIYLVFITRFFSQEEIGIFYFALSIVGVVGTFTDFGFATMVFRYIPYYEGKGWYSSIHKVLKIAIFVGLLSSAVFTIALFIFADDLAFFLNNPASSSALRLLSLTLILNEAFSLVNSILLGRKMVKEGILLNNVQNVAKIAFTILLLYFVGSSSISLSTAVALSIVAAVVFVFPSLLSSVNSLPSKSKEKRSYMELFKEVLPYSFMLYLIPLFDNVINYADRILLGYFGGGDSSSLVAVYSIALTLAYTPTLFAASIKRIFLPVISEIYGKNHQDISSISHMTHLGTKMTVLFSIPIVLVFFAFPSEMLSLLYGKSYEAGALALVILNAGMFLYLFSYMQRVTLSSFRAIKASIVLVAVSALFNVVLNIFLIPKYGLEGAAVASAFSLIVLSLLTQIYSKKLFEHAIDIPTFAKFALSFIVPLAFLLLAKPLLLSFSEALSSNFVLGDSYISKIVHNSVALALIGIASLIASLLYAASLLLSRAFDNVDIKILGAIMRKGKIPEKIVVKVEDFILSNKLVRGVD